MPTRPVARPARLRATPTPPSHPRKQAKPPQSVAAIGKQLREHADVVPQPPTRWMKEQLPPMLVQWGAFGGFIGRRKRAGEWLAEPCLIVMTLRKHDPARGRGHVKRVPASVVWKDGRRVGRLATDVLEVLPSFEMQLSNVLGPGDGVAVGAARASVGAAVLHPRAGRCVLTAGHVVVEGGGAAGRGATVFSDGTGFSARVADYRLETTIDYAVIQPAAGAECDNLFRDVYRIGPVYTPTAADVGATVFLLDGAGAVTRTTCRGVGGHFDTGRGTYFDVLQTDCISNAGQSGGALIDGAQRLWGFLIGALDGQFSIYAPAQLILDAAGVRLIQG